MADVIVSRGALVENGRTGSILELLELLRSTGKDELPKQLTVSETERSTIRHDEWNDLAEIPVIDLSLLQTDRAGVVKQIHKAVTEWGFFQILNHGLHLEVLKEVQAQGLKFFELPFEIKERAHLLDDGLTPYTGNCSKRSVSSLHWAESLSIYFDYVDKVVDQVWPDGNQEFRDIVKKFSSGSEVIGRQLLQLIAESLGLATDFFTQHVAKRNFQPWRWNYYPVCPRPSDSLGATSHTDPNCITVLLQDKVGGLQMEKDGQWIGIKPIEGALVINIGDTLHAWTNGICKSVLHRVVVNTEVPRLSVVSFLSVDPQFPISPPDKLIDDSHPRRYKNLTPAEYMFYMIHSRNEDKSTVRNGIAVLGANFKFED